MSNVELKVTSHVPRDLLQSAALFKTDKHVVWEYVANSIQYIDAGTIPNVVVNINSRQKKISIRDNGSGMDWNGLKNFFIMHGENIDRKRGKLGRGMFGTGKSAAFGIADLLRITTVRKGKRSKVELTRSSIEAMGSGDEIPVEVLEKEIPTQKNNGTFVEIENIHIRSFDIPGVRSFIERNLGHARKDVSVLVNNHSCEFIEPPINETKVIKSEGNVKDILGNVKLIIKISKAPLDASIRGIQIWSNGQLLETTLAEAEGRDLCQYIFGEINIPALYEDKSPIPPFDMSRTKKLNPNNELVRAIYAFIGRKVEEVRRHLVEEDKKRKAKEENKKLEKQADEIAQILNDDFDAYRRYLAKARAKASGAYDQFKESDQGGTDDDDFIFGGELPVEFDSENGATGSDGGQQHSGQTPREMNPIVSPGDQNSPKAGKKAGGQGKQKKPSGGFKIEYKALGQDSNRATYRSEERTIFINLDHPQLVVVNRGNNIENPDFRRLSYEIAFTEYSVALVSELANKELLLDILEAIDEVRDTIDRLSRKAANLFE